MRRVPGSCPGRDSAASADRRRAWDCYRARGSVHRAQASSPDRDEAAWADPHQASDCYPAWDSVRQDRGVLMKRAIPSVLGLIGAMSLMTAVAASAQPSGPLIETTCSYPQLAAALQVEDPELSARLAPEPRTRQAKLQAFFAPAGRPAKATGAAEACPKTRQWQAKDRRRSATPPRARRRLSAGSAHRRHLSLLLTDLAASTVTTSPPSRPGDRAHLATPCAVAIERTIDRPSPAPRLLAVWPSRRRSVRCGLQSTERFEQLVHFPWRG